MMIIKRVGSGWTWFEDYAYLSATYRCFTPFGRHVQVGKGIFAFGKPRGEKIEIVNDGQFTVLGIGAIYIRIYDGGPDCEVGITQEISSPIPVLRSSFP